MFKTASLFFQTVGPQGPIIVNYATTASLGTSGAYAINVNIPSGTQAGDLLLLLGNSWSGSTIQDVYFGSGPDTGTTWNQVPNQIDHANARYIQASGAEPSTVLVTSAAPQIAGAFIVLLIRGHNVTTPISTTGLSANYDAVAKFTASWSGTTLTVTAVSSGTLTIGNVIGMNGAPANSTIVSQLSGTTGGIGTYQMSTSTTLSSRAGNSNNVSYSPPIIANPSPIGLLLHAFYSGADTCYTGSGILSLSSPDISQVGTTQAYTGGSNKQPSVSVFAKNDISTGSTLSTNFTMSKASVISRLFTIIVNN